jgi:hypothetical protein
MSAPDCRLHTRLIVSGHFKPDVAGVKWSDSDSLRGMSPISSQWHGTCKHVSMKNLILCCLAAVSLVSLAACSSDSDKTSMSTQSSSTTMQTDSKDMKK